MYPVVIICVIQWSFWITIILCKFRPNINVKLDVLFFSHICREIVNVCCTSVLGFIYLNSSIFLKYVTHVYICVWKAFFSQFFNSRYNDYYYLITVRFVLQISFVPRHFATSPTGITSGTGTAYHCEAHEFTPGF
jgi:hypothetical protein